MLHATSFDSCIQLHTRCYDALKCSCADVSRTIHGASGALPVRPAFCNGLHKGIWKHHQSKRRHLAKHCSIVSCSLVHKPHEAQLSIESLMCSCPAFLMYSRLLHNEIPRYHRSNGKAHLKVQANLIKCWSAGEELYLIPGIDMMNHTCLRGDCNTSLQRSGPAGCVPVAVQAPQDTSGASPASPAVPCFIMHAGEG